MFPYFPVDGIGSQVGEPCLCAGQLRCTLIGRTPRRWATARGVGGSGAKISVAKSSRSNSSVFIDGGQAIRGACRAARDLLN